MHYSKFTHVYEMKVTSFVQVNSKYLVNMHVQDAKICIWITLNPVYLHCSPKERL